MNPETAAAIVEVYKELDRQRLNFGSAGNVSVRLGAQMLITPTGATAASLTAAELVLMPVGGPAPAGTGPSSEWPMHSAVYEVCPEATCVVHTHADSCTALACLNEPLPAFHYMVAVAGGSDVPLVPYFTFGTPELSEGVAHALQQSWHTRNKGMQRPPLKQNAPAAARPKSGARRRR